VLNILSKAKRLKPTDKPLTLGYGFVAIPNKDNTTSIQLKKRIKGVKSPVTLLLGKLPIDNEEEIFKKGMDYSSLCAKGIHPKEYEREQARIEEEKEKKKKANEKTLGLILEQYNMAKLSLEQNTKETIRDRNNCIKSICSDWFDTPIKEISYDMIFNRFQDWSSQRGSKGRAKTWGSYCQAIWEFAFRRRYIQANIFKQLKDEVGGFNSNQETNNFLTPSECSYLYDKAIEYSKEDWEGLVDYEQAMGWEHDHFHNYTEKRMAMVLLLLTGLRLNEVLKLKWEQVFLNKKFFPQHFKSNKALLENDLNQYNIIDDEAIPHIFFDKGTRKQKKIMLAIPIVSAMEQVFNFMLKYRQSYCIDENGNKFDWHKKLRYNISRLKNQSPENIKEYRHKKNKEYAELKKEVSPYVFPSNKVLGSHITDIDSALLECTPPTLNTKENNIGVGKIKRVEKLTAKTLRRTFSQVGLYLKFDINTLEFITGRTANLKTTSAFGSYVSNHLQMSIEPYEKIIMALLNKSEYLEDVVMLGLSEEEKERLDKEHKKTEIEMKKYFDDFMKSGFGDLAEYQKHLNEKNKNK
jgi:integrase